MKTLNDNFIFNEMVFELTKDILKFSENPSTAVHKIIDEIRELTGAKIVALCKSSDDSANNEKPEFQLQHINPERKKDELDEELLSDLADLIKKERKITVISEVKNINTYDNLKKLRYDLSVLLPMILNDTFYGCFIILGLPTKVNLEIILQGLETLSEAFTLIYRYSLLYTKMETMVVERTKDLKKSEENLRITLNSVGDAVIATNVDGIITNINPVAEKITGWKSDEAIGKSIETVFNIINENTREKVENPVEKVLEEGTIVGLANHTLLISKDRREIPIADSGSPIKNEKGETFGVVLVFRDQTKERAARKKLKESEEKYRNLIELAQEGIWAIDENAKTTFANLSMAKMLGYSPEEMIGRSLFSFMDEKSMENGNKNIERRKRCIKEQHEFEFLRKDGRRIYTILATSPIMNEKGDYIGAIAGVIDITDRKRAENDLRKKNSELQIFYNAAVGRELKMIELKKEINSLLEKNGEKPKYDIIG